VPVELFENVVERGESVLLSRRWRSLSLIRFEVGHRPVDERPIGQDLLEELTRSVREPDDVDIVRFESGAQLFDEFEASSCPFDRGERLVERHGEIDIAPAASLASDMRSVEEAEPDGTSLEYPHDALNIEVRDRRLVV
jgi:hypothetical protein